MVARMIVRVRDERVEAHSTKELRQVLRLVARSRPPYLGGKEQIGPFLTLIDGIGRVVRIEQRQCAHHSAAEIPFLGHVSIEPLHQQNVLVSDGCHPAFGT